MAMAKETFTTRKNLKVHPLLHEGGAASPADRESSKAASSSSGESDEEILANSLIALDPTAGGSRPKHAIRFVGTVSDAPLHTSTPPLQPCCFASSPSVHGYR